MNDKFDELARKTAQSVTRRGALKKFGVGFAGIVLTSLGLANKTQAAKRFHCRCHKPNYGCPLGDTECVSACSSHCEPTPI